MKGDTQKVMGVQRISIMIFISLALHGGIALWLSLSLTTPATKPAIQHLHINLLVDKAGTTPSTEPLLAPTQPANKPPTPQSQPKAAIKPQPAPAQKTVAQTPPLILQSSAESAPTPQQHADKVETPKQVLTREQPSNSEARPEIPATPSAQATAQYEQLLAAWLEKHKHYPYTAQRLRIEGTGMLRISINRAGRTQQITLEQRTGNRLLDKAALEMAKRANPFPPMPKNDPRQVLEFTVPIVFALR